MQIDETDFGLSLIAGIYIRGVELLGPIIRELVS
jgi:hypothetical protein